MTLFEVKCDYSCEYKYSDFVLRNNNIIYGEGITFSGVDAHPA